VEYAVCKLGEWLDCCAEEDVGIEVDKVCAMISMVSEVERLISAVFNRVSDFSAPQDIIETFAASGVCGKFSTG
jgi:hypothetical protein